MLPRRRLFLGKPQAFVKLRVPRYIVRRSTIYRPPLRSSVDAVSGSYHSARAAVFGGCGGAGLHCPAGSYGGAGRHLVRNRASSGLRYNGGVQYAGSTGCARSYRHPDADANANECPSAGSYEHAPPDAETYFGARRTYAHPAAHAVTCPYSYPRAHAHGSGRTGGAGSPVPRYGRGQLGLPWQLDER